MRARESDLCSLLEPLPNSSSVEKVAKEVRRRIECQNSAQTINNGKLLDGVKPTSDFKIVIVVQVICVCFQTL